MACTPGRLTASTTSTGSAIAITLNQYCSACTRVIDRIPPATTFSVTTSATPVTPTQRGQTGDLPQHQAGAVQLRHQVEPGDGQHQRGAQSTQTP